MSRKSTHDPLRIREEIAMAAARMIAEDGLDYATAKRKAARTVLGDNRPPGDWLPDNDAIETEVRAYQALFQADAQPVILHLLQRLAVHLMEALAPYLPHITGAVWNGTASKHSDIHLQLFCDNPKDVAIFLLNAGVDFDVSETAHFSRMRSHAGHRHAVETLSFLWRGQWPAGPQSRELANEIRRCLPGPIGIHLALYERHELRQSGRHDTGKSARASLATLRQTMTECAAPTAQQT